MTAQEIINYYADLLILQYKGQPKAYATIQTLAGLSVLPQETGDDTLPIAVQNAFSIDTAVGAQLDTIGKYVGISRNQRTFSGPVSLSDSDFRMLIKVKTIQNNSGSSLANIQYLLRTFFPDTLLVFDFQNMQINYYFNAEFGSRDLAEIFVSGGLLPRPMGVALKSLIFVANITNIFGFRTYGLAGYNVSGFNSYDDYITTRPWLSYTNAVA